MAPMAEPQHDPAVSGIGWSFVVPVKELSVAKSRLPYPQPVRAALALAMAQDVVATLRATPGVRRVVLITDDPDADAAFADAAVVVADEPRAGLSAALRHGALVAAARWPLDGVAALASDVPAATPQALARVLAAIADLPAPRHPSRIVVADSAGLGTVLLAAEPGRALDPRFEGGSRAAHLRTGAIDLTDHAAAGLRRDVDTQADLVAAATLGLGPATRRALSEHGLHP